LYGQELDATTNPYAAGLGWVIKPEAKDFIGRAVILSGKEAGLKQKLVGFKMVERGIARHDYRVLSVDNKEIGRVTSGTVSPSLNENIGIAYVDAEFSAVGSEIFVDIRGKSVKAHVVPTPFVKTSLTANKSAAKGV
jgi:aminomethyltransferase